MDSAHPELSNSNIVNLWSYNQDFSDPLGHGTSMASVIVGSTLGVVPDAELKSVKIPYGSGVTNTTLLEAFDAILEDHLLTPSVVKVVNCSWVISKSEVLDTKILELQNNGLVVVAAAGNTISAADDFSPVGLNTVIGVAACDAYDRVVNWGTGVGSNWGPEVDITAPGIEVYCAKADGTVDTSSGTSLAAAITSGVVCQFIVENVSMTANEIQQAVINHGSDDLLFRNETIYNTTPNKLLQGIFFGGLFLQPNITDGTEKIFVSKGSSVDFNIAIANNVISRLSIEEFYTGRVLRLPPSWVSLNTTTNVITFAPTAETETKKYLVYVEGLSSDGIQVGFCRFIVHVYDESPEELAEDDKPEYYTRNSSTNTVVPAIGYCYEGSCPYPCGGLYATKSQAYCGCSWTYGSCNSF